MYTWELDVWNNPSPMAKLLSTCHSMQLHLWIIMWLSGNWHLLLTHNDRPSPIYNLLSTVWCLVTQIFTFTFFTFTWKFLKSVWAINPKNVCGSKQLLVSRNLDQRANVILVCVWACDIKLQTNSATDKLCDWVACVPLMAKCMHPQCSNSQTNCCSMYS